MSGDDDFGTRLPLLLLEEPLPPSTVDIGLAITTGKRHRRSRYAASGLAVLTLAVAIPIAIQSQRPQAPPLVTRPTEAARTCRVVTNTDGIRNLVTDPSGQYFGGYELGPAFVSDWYAAFWKDGVAQRIPLPDGRHGVIKAINSAGVAVGESNRPLSSPGQNLNHAFVYRYGTAKLLAGGDNVHISSISEAGVITGTRSASNGGQPVMWKSPDSERIDLPVPADATFRVGGGPALDDGSVVGNVTTSKASHAVYRWSPQGTGEIMVVPEADYSAVTSAGGHWIYGAYIGASGERGTFRLDLNGVVQKLPDFHVGHQASSGWVAGYQGKYAMGQDWPPNLPAALTNGTAWIPIPAPAEGRRIGLNSVSADGRVVTGVDAGPVEQPFRVGPELERSIIWRCGD